MVNFKVFLGTIVLFFLASSTVCSKNSTSNNKQGTGHGKLPGCTLSIINNNGSKIKATVEVASDEAARQKGLMYRKSLPVNHGMLFAFEIEQDLRFWMKDTYIHLDIAYISRKGFINEIYYMKPLDISVTYSTTKPAQYALEMNAGWFKKNNISPGRRVVFNGCFGK